MSCLCSPGTVWQPSWEISSHTAHQGMLVYHHLSLLSNCGLILCQKVELVQTSYLPLKLFKKI